MKEEEKKCGDEEKWKKKDGNEEQNKRENKVLEDEARMKEERC